jgi:transposase
MNSKAEAIYQRRKKAVEAVMSGEVVALVARVHRVPLRTIFGWLSRYRQGGWHALRDEERSGRPRKLSAEAMGWLYRMIQKGDPRQCEFPFSLWTLKVIRAVLKKRWNVSLSQSAISRLLKHLGLSPQRPIYRSYKRDPREMERYLQITFPQLKERAKAMGGEIYFVDESSIRSDHHSGTTWGLIGETPVVEDGGDRFSLKMISAVTLRGDMRFAVIEERMNSDVFIDFLQKLRADAGRPIIVIADNAPCHTSAKVMAFIASTNGEITLANLPRYSPELNPDEQVWNHTKRRLSQAFIDTKETMKSTVLSIMKSIQRTPSLIKSFFGLPETCYAS